ncbi:pilus assembly protein [Brevibacterium samyangense]|uniref:Pilus assembly protein n=1 Tax=Brevibacterium samyangense TaxID=366888 RepID=A0ABN2TKV4_9MICO
MTMRGTVRKLRRQARAVSARVRTKRDGGAMSIELVLVIPILFMVLALVFGFGRVAIVQANFDAGVRDAARAATQSDTGDQAYSAATKTLRDATSRASQECTDTLDVEPIDNFSSGQFVTVSAKCRYPMAQMFGVLPGHMWVSSTFTSPLDTNKEFG